MKKMLFCLVAAGVLSSVSPVRAFAEWKDQGYFKNWGYDWARSFKNIVSSPAEIPITIKEYDAKEGRPVLRHTAGFFDGFFQAIARAGSGIWDFGAAVIPGQQEGIPVDPEVLF